MKRNLLLIGTMAILLAGCAGVVVTEEVVDEPLCPPEDVSTSLCINNPQGPCCDPGLD